MQAFNDCRCQRCGKSIGWFGELSDPPVCSCGHKSDYSDTERKLAEAREKAISNSRFEQETN